MRFVDEAVINVEGGKGGDGCTSFRREKFVPRGGPDGGDGGDGGSVFLTGSRKLWTLADFLYKRHYKAQPGAHGKGKNMHGKSGASITIHVPLGTDIYDLEKKSTIGEVLEEKTRILVACGGKGGRGNTAFKKPTNTAPRKSESGKQGEKRILRLVLRLLADISLIGFPNAGKSTLLKRITRARPKIAAYPFTTLSPNLGILKTDSAHYTIADMPGIVEGAYQGKGLGLRFLRHIERTRFLIFVIDITKNNPQHEYELLKKEIIQYNPDLLKKRWLIVLNKIDRVETVPSLSFDYQTLYVSAHTGEGMDDLIHILENEMVTGE